MEQLKPQRPVHFSSEAYLEFEEAASTKHELHEGVLVAMAGGTLNHSVIASNLNFTFRSKLVGKPCLVLNSDLRVRIGKSVNYYYPDISVVCGPPKFDPPDRRTTLINPQLIVEVASDSTVAFDSREKFRNYMRIGSLQEYVLIYQGQPCVDTFYCQPDGVWAIGPSYEGLEAVATLRLQGGVQLPLRDIYTGVEWPKPQEKKPADADASAEPTSPPQA